MHWTNVKFCFVYNFFGFALKYEVNNFTIICLYHYLQLLLFPLFYLLEGAPLDKIENSQFVQNFLICGHKILYLQKEFVFNQVFLFLNLSTNFVTLSTKKIFIT